MKKISVVDVLATPVLLSTEKGKTLFSVIIDELKNNDTITLDFAGYNFISTSFFNNSFGDLIVHYDWDLNSLLKHIKIIGLSEDDFDDLKLSIANARYRKDLMDKGLNPEEIYSTYISI